MRAGKWSIIGAVALVLLGGAIFGGLTAAEALAQRKVDSVLASLARSLPPGTTLTHGDVSLRPLSLSATVADVRLQDRKRGLDAQVETVAVSRPTFRGGSLATVTLGLEGLRLHQAGTDTGGGRALTLRRADVNALDMRQLTALARRAKTSRTVLDAAALAGLRLGDVRLTGINLAEGDGGRTVMIARFEMEGISGGRVGPVSVRGADIRSGDKRLQFETFVLSGLDLGRVAAWYDRTGGDIYREARLDIDFFGIETATVNDGTVTISGVPVVFRRFEVLDLDSRNNFPTRMTARIDGLKAPLSIIPEKAMTPDLAAFLKRTNVAGQDLSFIWHHQLDEAARRLTVGPMVADLGTLGRFSGQLVLSNVDRAALAEIADDQARLITAVKIRGGTVDIEGREATGALIDFLAAQSKTTRQEMIDRVSGGDIAASSTLLLGQQVGSQLTGALAGFLRRPGTFQFSADAGDGAMSLEVLGTTIARSAERTARAYNIRAAYLPPGR